MTEGRGAQAPQTAARRMAGFWAGIPVEPPRPFGDFRRIGAHAGTVSWFVVKEHRGHLTRLEPVTEE